MEGVLRTSRVTEPRTIQYRPLPAAHQIHSKHQVRERALVGGIGSGKTMAGAWDAILQMTGWNPGMAGMVVAPTYPMLRDSTKRTFFEVLPPELIKSFNKTEGHLVLTNGSEAFFRSAEDPDRLRGPNLAWVWLDEGQEAPGRGWWRVGRTTRPAAGIRDGERAADLHPQGYELGLSSVR